MSSYNVELDGLDGAQTSALAGAEVTASTFDILGVRPLLGRTLGPGDETASAPPVTVIGYRLWQTTLGGRADIVGQQLRIGGVLHTVVGVMPGGFWFPSRQELWLPVRDRETPDRETARPITIVGHLADGVSPDAAQAELTSIAAVVPRTGLEADRLRPEVVPTAYMTFGLPKGGLRSTPDYYIAQLLTLAPLLIACVNVGLLIFARTATRTSEFAVRTALGASRGRIVAQVFTESLVLALVATGAGLLILNWLPSRALAMTGFVPPYWLDPGLTRWTVLRGLGMAALSAAIAGVVPALRTTGRSVQRNMQRANARRSGTRFGGLSSALIIADVAIAVAAVGFAAVLANQVRKTMGDVKSDGIDASRYLSFELRSPDISAGGNADQDEAAATARLADTERAMVAALKSEPGVRGVAVADVLPRMEHRGTRIEVDGDGVPRRAKARTAAVAPEFFAELHQPILAGRAFNASDLRPGADAVIVNTSFVTRVLGGASPLGRRVRLPTWDDKTSPGPWFEIVGVVGHLGVRSINPDMDEAIYQPLRPGTVQPLRVAIEVGDDPARFAPRLREIARAVDPQLVIAAVTPLDRQFEGDWYVVAAAAAGALVLVGVLLTLAASGIYAIMSFAVVERTREIGIRVALGADRGRIAMHIARRALLQIGAGVMLGMLFTWPAFFELQHDESGVSLWLSAISALVPGICIMVLVALVACAAPTLRALRISPIDALRGD